MKQNIQPHYFETATTWHEYELLDSGDGKILERFGKMVLVRPYAQAFWPKSTPELWQENHARFQADVHNFGGANGFAKTTRKNPGHCAGKCYVSRHNWVPHNTSAFFRKKLSTGYGSRTRLKKSPKSRQSAQFVGLHRLNKSRRHSCWRGRDPCGQLKTWHRLGDGKPKAFRHERRPHPIHSGRTP